MHPIKRKIINMPPRKPIYEGKAKQLFEGPEPGTLIQHFKDDATAFNNVKKGVINGKGVLNNRISEYLMLRLHEMSIPTHFIRTLNMREPPAPPAITLNIRAGSMPALAASANASPAATLWIATRRLATYFILLPLPKAPVS